MYLPALFSKDFARRLWTVLFALGALSLLSAKAETLTYADLVHRLTDLQHLATPPLAGEQAALASSYDRHSLYDAKQDKYLDWGANQDGDGIIRKEGDKSVLAEIEGPGCIWRTWSASPRSGHVKIYLDGHAEPAVDLPFIGYFDGKNEPFTRSNLVYKTTARGFDNYTPIPFQKSCRIVADPEWGAFYHFNYTRFAPGTVVPTFKLPLAKEDTAALDEANRLFGSCGSDPAGERPGQKTDASTVTVEPGKQLVVANLKGPETITGLRVSFDLPPDMEKQRLLLRQLAIRISWDGEKEPSVWAPWGDFFGISKGAVPHSNLPSGLAEDHVWYSYWYMPFTTGAVLSVDNDGDQPVTMKWEVTHAPLDANAGPLLRFHAKWHRDAFLPTREDRRPDWTLLTTQGQGRYVGTQLHVWHPSKVWWGEGDEKFFIDGEKFPSTFGTGSEDYFGYAWSSGLAFIQALHSQPMKADDWIYGNVSVNRWHVPDNIPFQTSFEGCLEKYFPNEKPEKEALYAATAFWYLAPGGKDRYGPAPLSERVGYWVLPPKPSPDH